MRVIALLEDPAVIRRILEHLGLWAPRAMQRSPPLVPRPGRCTPACRSPTTRFPTLPERRAGHTEHRSVITAALHWHRMPATDALIFLFLYSMTCANTSLPACGSVKYHFNLLRAPHCSNVLPPALLRSRAGPRRSPHWDEKLCSLSTPDHRQVDTAHGMQCKHNLPVH